MYVISIPVHEQGLVVVDQLRNFLKFTDANIILHVSRQFLNDLECINHFVKNEPRVHINENRHNTGWGSIIQTHLSNFHEAERVFGDFTHFVMHASNDMFVRHGVNEYVKSNECSFQMGPTFPEMMWTPRRRAVHDFQLHAMMNFLGLTEMFLSQPEGIFFEKKMFSEICNVIDKFYDQSKILPYMTKDQNDTKNTIYAREEIYFSTLAQKFYKIRSEPHLYSEVMTNIFVNQEIIDGIRNSNLDHKFCVESRFFNPPNEFQIYDVKNIFAVKRISRNMFDPLREYVRNLT